jgi:branched-chain amino acid transport system permease protein
VEFLALTAIQIVDSIASLALIGIGLAVIFGMMRVINLAHGEFIMLGGFATIFAVNAGINLWLAMLVVAPAAVGLLGLFVERLIIRHLYGRMIDTMLASLGAQPAADRPGDDVVWQSRHGRFGPTGQRSDRRLQRCAL